MLNNNLPSLIKQKRIIIAIDGPAASGKSALGRALAEKFQINFLDSGQIYRLLIWFYQKKQIDFMVLNNNLYQKYLSQFKTKLKFENNTFYFEEKPINEKEIYNPEINQIIPHFVNHKWVRNTVNKICHEIMKKDSFVVVGRDAATVIVPLANFKFFLNAKLEVRAKRKLNFWIEQQKKATQKCNTEEQKIVNFWETKLTKQGIKNEQLNNQKKILSIIKNEISKRDQNDYQRSIGKLQKTDDAYQIDNTHQNLTETINKVVKIIESNWTILNKIAIIGQTNVGKSTLFNALLKKKEALVAKVAHTTRDAHSKEVQINNYHFHLIDTGGINYKSDDKLEKIIAEKSREVINQADYLIWMVDFQKPITIFDEMVSEWIKLKKKETILVINKAEKSGHIKKITKFDQLGIKEQILISAKNKINIKTLIQAILKRIKPKLDFQPKITEINVALVGKTNVGKSTFFNAFLQKKVAITFEQPHTTTNIIEKSFFYNNYKINFIDTAGIRKKRNKKTILEKKALTQIQEVLERIDVIILICDINQELTVQDKKITRVILETKKPFLVIGNKKDLVQISQATLIKKTKKFIPKLIKMKIPVFIISALKNLVNRKSILKTIINLFQQKK